VIKLKEEGYPFCVRGETLFAVGSINGLIKFLMGFSQIRR
jgi:hypothetical protein